MRKSRESRWTCKTPAELLRCSSVGKAAAQSAEPDQESSAAVSALRRRRRMALCDSCEVAKGRLLCVHPVNFTPSPGARPWVPSPPRRLECLSCSQVAHINITKTNHSPPQTILVYTPPKPRAPPRDGGPPHTTRKLETYIRTSSACKSPAAGAAAPSLGVQRSGSTSTVSYDGCRGCAIWPVAFPSPWPRPWRIVGTPHRVSRPISRLACTRALTT